MSPKQAVVGFMDILGFKEMIHNLDQEKIEDLYDHKISSNIDKINKVVKVNQDFNLPLTEVLHVSDSIILWNEEVNDMSIYMLLSQVRDLMGYFLRRGMPLRGAITVGELSVRLHNNYSNVFGKALTSAYTLESNQQWSGCIIDDRCIKLLDEEVVERLEASEEISRYLVPKKNGPVIEHFVINWAKDPQLKNYNTSHFKNAFCMHRKRIDSWDVRMKMDNTIKFYKGMNGKR